MQLRYFEGALLDASSAKKLGITIAGGLELATGKPVCGDMPAVQSECLTEPIFEPLGAQEMKAKLSELKRYHDLARLLKHCDTKNNYQDADLVFHFIANLIDMPNWEHAPDEIDTICSSTQWRIQE